MPRAAAPDAGLRGPSRTFAPNPARDAGRALALVTIADVYRETFVKVDGASTKADVLEASGVAARIDPIASSGGAGGLIGDQIDETSTHIVSMNVDMELTTQHAIMLDGSSTRWAVVATHAVSDGVLLRVEVRAQ